VGPRVATGNAPTGPPGDDGSGLPPIGPGLGSIIPGLGGGDVSRVPMPFKGPAGASPALAGSAAPIVGGTGRGFAVEGCVDEGLPGAAGREADFGSAGNLAGGRAAGADSGLPLRFSPGLREPTGLLTEVLPDSGGCVAVGSATAGLLAELFGGGCAAIDALAGIVLPPAG